MSPTMSLQVPVDEVESLEELLRTLQAPSETSRLHPFDGETVVQAVVTLSGAAIPILRIWLRARVEARKSYRLVYDGTEYEGYDVKEIERLVQVLKADVDAG
jgi:shikimate kinase